jgi:glutamyl-tRNA synthetase
VMTLTARVLHERRYAAVAEKLSTAGVEGPRAEPFWLAIRGNLATMADVPRWRDIVFGDSAGMLTELDYLAEAARLLPLAPFTEDTWGVWTDALKSATGRKGRALFMPLRLALTGLEHGPELKGLLPLMGRARVLARLS